MTHNPLRLRPDVEELLTLLRHSLVGHETDMDGKEIVRWGLSEYWHGLRKALSGLTAAERRFQPHTRQSH